MHRRRITSTIGAAVAAAGLSLSLLSPAPAVARPVVDTDFPSVEDVGAIYSFYEDGGSQVVDNEELILITRDCLHDRVGPTAPYGAYALYWGSDANPSPLDDGGPEPRVEVFWFNSKARAHQVLDKIRDNVARCYGRSADGPRVRKRSEITVPALGSEPPLGWRTHVKNRPARDEVPEYHTIDIWMRRGRFLVLVNVAQMTAPRKARVVNLAEVALESIG